MSAAKRRKPRKPLPPPKWSELMYAQLEPKYIGMFRFLMEAEDNIGYMSVVDKFTAIIKIVYSPHQKREVTAFLDGMRETIPFTILPKI